MDRARTTVRTGGREHALALRAVARLVFTHAFAEESVLFPAARAVLPEGDPLTLRIEREHQEVDDLVARPDGASPEDPEHEGLMRRTTPTRAHPVVSRRPPGQALSALPLTVLDRTRDGLQRRDEVTGGRAAPVLGVLDGLLAGAAGGVERLPLLRRGERVETAV